MTSPIIRFQSVHKRYRLRSSRSIRDIFIGTWRRPSNGATGQFWALNDISFEIQPGEAVGLVGPNGAGKSTTLKLISGVASPTSGRVEVRGRVGALLELGAGFHPELTGRENIYLNAALLGMSRPEVQRKFDAMVAFSELADFLDMPVKHYSSGMFMRLAFSVNIHVDPEILLVDEVLAVGDYNFQRKCLDRLSELKRQGVTIFLVSHVHDAIREHCTRAIWLDHGRVMADGASEAVVQQYLSQGLAQEAQRIAALTGQAGAHRWGSRRAEIDRVRITDEQGRECALFETGQCMRIGLEYTAHERIPAPVFGLAIHRQDGLHVCGPNTGFAGLRLPDLTARGRVWYTIPHLPLLEGLYYISVSVHDQTGLDIYDYHDRLYPFRVVNLPNSRVKERFGLMTVQGEWRHEAEGT